MYKDLFRTIHVSHAAHVGGFLVGALLALKMGGFRLAMRDQLWDKASTFIGKGIGLGNIIKDMKVLTHFNPREAAAFCEIGEAEAKLGNHENAKKNLERGISLFAQKESTLSEACYWMYIWFRYYPKDLPENKTLSLNVAKAFAQNQEVQKALHIYDHLADNSDVPSGIREQASFHRATLVCEKLANYETGLALYDRFFEIYPNSKFKTKAQLRYEHFKQMAFAKG